MCRSPRTGFTLIEVLIVVVIMAILAATVIPQFAASTKDAKDSTLKFNLQTLQSQISMYAVHHNGGIPGVSNNTIPNLLGATDAQGNLSSTGALTVPTSSARMSTRFPTTLTTTWPRSRGLAQA